MKQQILSIMKRENYRPIKLKDFIYLLGAGKPKEKERLISALNELIEEKVIRLNSAQRYEWYRLASEKEGIFRSSKGQFGFVEIDDVLFEQDIFVPGNETKGAYNNDTVLVQILNEGSASKKPEGKIVKIIKRAPQIYVGTFHKSKNFGFVVPDQRDAYDDVFIPKEKSMGANHLDKVQIEIMQFPKLKHQKPEGRVLHVLGSAKSDGVDMLALIYKYQLPNEFPENVLKEADSLGTNTLEEKNKRVDLTDEIVVTIDGATAKDLDDAVCVKRTEEGYRLIVSIADVSYYVPEHSDIDKEAYERGTSVYLPDRAVPMLPRTLSENLCSLNPNEAKLTMSADMTINLEGKVIRNEFYKSVIRSKARFVYNEVNDLLSGNVNGLPETYLKYENELFLMKELAEILYKRRMQQ